MHLFFFQNGPHNFKVFFLLLIKISQKLLFFYLIQLIMRFFRNSLRIRFFLLNDSNWKNRQIFLCSVFLQYFIHVSHLFLNEFLLIQFKEWDFRNNEDFLKSSGLLMMCFYFQRCGFASCICLDCDRSKYFINNILFDSL